MHFSMVLFPLCVDSVCSGPLTSAVLGTDGVAVETRSAPIAAGAGGVAPAVLTDASHVVTLVEDKVRVGVPVTVAPLTRAPNQHGVAIVAWSTPV